MLKGKFALRIRYKRGYTDVLVAQCVEMPFIIVEAKTPDDLFKEITHELIVYFNTFPDEGNRVIKQLQEQQTIQDNVPTKTEDLETQEGWTEKMIEVPIPRQR